MTFSKKLIIGDKISNKKFVLNTLKQGQAIYSIYLVCMANKKDDVFEIIHSIEFQKDYYKDESYKVIGIGNSKKEAFEIVHNLIKNIIINEEDTNNMKNYFTQMFFE